MAGACRWTRSSKFIFCNLILEIDTFSTYVELRFAFWGLVLALLSFSYGYQIVAGFSLIVEGIMGIQGTTELVHAA
jgi:hypothetical protein